MRGQKDSVYSLAMNDEGTVLVAGGTDKVDLLYIVCIYREYYPYSGLCSNKSIHLMLLCLLPYTAYVV